MFNCFKVLSFSCLGEPGRIKGGSEPSDLVLAYRERFSDLRKGVFVVVETEGLSGAKFSFYSNGLGTNESEVDANQEAAAFLRILKETQGIEKTARLHRADVKEPVEIYASYEVVLTPEEYNKFLDAMTIPCDTPDGSFLGMQKIHIKSTESQLQNSPWATLLPAAYSRVG